MRARGGLGVSQRSAGTAATLLSVSAATSIMDVSHPLLVLLSLLGKTSKLGQMIWQLRTCSVPELDRFGSLSQVT